MSIRSEIQAEQKVLTISVDGTLDAQLFAEFQLAYKDVPAYFRCVIDLSGVDYVDSSGLGLLLILREHFGSDNATVEIRGCSEDVANVLYISNFDVLFSMR